MRSIEYEEHRPHIDIMNKRKGTVMGKISKSNFLRRRQRVNRQVRNTTTAAGVLPIATSDSQERVILLGSSQSYQGGKFQHFWSDFGGRLDGDESVKEAAFREFHEETANFFKGSIKSPSDLVKMHSTEKYASFVAEVPYVSIDKIKENAEKLRQNGTMYERNHIEMDDYKWLPLKELLAPAGEVLLKRIFPPFVEFHLQEKNVQDFLTSLTYLRLSQIRDQMAERRKFGQFEDDDSIGNRITDAHSYSSTHW